MQPTQFIRLSQLPLTINGKVDKSLLVQHLGEPVAPAKEQEGSQELVELLVELLDDKHVQIDRHHSLLAQGIDSLTMALFLARVLKRYLKDKRNLDLFLNNREFIHNPSLTLIERLIGQELE